MGIQEGTDWAWRVVRRGRPGSDLSLAAKAEAYGDLGAAWHVLAEVAAGEGDMDTYITRSELAQNADELARQYLGPEEVDRW